jgi:RNA polymerase sigma-70 factor (ECF subfamily)
MLRCDLDAEDVTQDVLLQVVRKLSGFRGDSAFPTWLHRVTVNAALLHRRRALRREYKIAGTLDDLSDERADRSSKRRWQRSPVNQLIEHETRLAVEKAISGLPDGYREVLIASDIDGLPNQAIAAALGLGLAAVKSRLHRARRMLRDALEPLFTERRPPTRAGA